MNTRVKTFLQNLELDGRIETIAKRYRAAFDLPGRGFESWNDYEQWRKKHVVSDTKEQERIANCHAFMREVKELVPYAAIIPRVNFELLLIDYYYYGNFDYEEVSSDADTNVYSIEVLKDGKPLLTPNEKLDDGVYIKVPPTATPKGIAKFLTENSSLLKSAMKFSVSASPDLATPHLKGFRSFKRDKLIYALWQDSRESLEEFYMLYEPNGFPPKTTKAIRVARMMREIFGYQDVTEELVKSTVKRIQRQIRILRGTRRNRD